ncbi:TetR/AcrR family transcriptional regulator [Rhodococcus sp. C26F]
MTINTRGPRGAYSKTATRRQEILTAAVEVFSSAGFHKGSLRDVAERVGLTQTGVLHHFPSKNHLLEAVLEWRDTESGAWLREDAPALDNVRALVALVERNQRETPEMAELYAVLAAEASSPDHPVHEYFRRRYAWVLSNVTGYFERLAESGELRPDVLPTNAARSTVAMIDGLQVQWLYDRDAVDMGAELRQHIRSLLTVDL